MANIAVKDASGNIVYMKATGSGTDLDPYVVNHAVTGPLTDAQLRAAAVPVAGPLTDTQLRATAVPVSGTVGVSGSVPVTGPATDAQLRATPLPVSGTVTGPLTDTQLRATAVPVSVASQPLPAGASTEATLAAQSAKLPATLGQKAMSASFAVAIASDQTPVTVNSQSALVRVNLTRPANVTAYTANDAMGDTGGSAIITFASFGVTGDNMLLTSLSFRYDVAALPTGMVVMRLHLYTASPTAIADNAAWDLVAGDRSLYVGYVDLPAIADFGSTLFTQTLSPPNKHVKLASTSLFGILQTIAGFTPAASSETFTVELGGVKL